MIVTFIKMLLPLSFNEKMTTKMGIIMHAVEDFVKFGSFYMVSYFISLLFLHYS